MKQLYFILYILFYAVKANAQQDKNWIIGYGGLDIADSIGISSVIFEKNSLKTVSESKSKIDFDATCAAISDKTGKLAFYTNGGYLVNSKHDSLKKGHLTRFGITLPIQQGVIILPFPEKDSLYCIIHQDDGSFFFPLPSDFIYGAEKTLYSVADMSKNNGLGEIIVKQKKLLPSDSVHLGWGRMAAIKQADGINWWIIGMEPWTATFYRFQLNKESISYIGKQKFGAALKKEGIGGTVFSMDGRTLAMRNNLSSTVGSNLIDIYDFDQCTGLVSNQRRLLFPDHVGGGIAISPNSRFLYLTFGDKIIQLDLKATDIKKSEKTVAVYDGFIDFAPAYFDNLQLGSDGKIYGSTYHSTRYLHVITKPDLPDTLCEVKQHSVRLATYNLEILPYFPNFRQAPITCSVSTNDNQDFLKYFSISPNPSDSEARLYFNIETETVLDFQLFDTSGSILQIHKIPQNTLTFDIQLTNYQKGMYFYTLKDEKGNIKSGKLIIL